MWKYCIAVGILLCQVYAEEFLGVETLEEWVSSTLNSGFELLDKHIDELFETIYQIKDSGLNLVEEHTLNVMQNFQMYDEAFRVFGGTEGNVSVCFEDLEPVVAGIRNKGMRRIKKAVDSNVRKLRYIFTKALPTFAKIQNKTSGLAAVAQDCARYNDEDCLKSIQERTDSFKEVLLPLVIQTLMNRMEMQITVLESRVTLDVQKIVNFVVEECSDIIFNCVQCLL